jgi:hypothetical protein
MKNHIELTIAREGKTTEYLKTLFPISQTRIEEYPKGWDGKDACKVRVNNIENVVIESLAQIKKLIEVSLYESEEREILHLVNEAIDYASKMIFNPETGLSRYGEKGKIKFFTISARKRVAKDIDNLKIKV